MIQRRNISKSLWALPLYLLVSLDLSALSASLPSQIDENQPCETCHTGVAKTFQDSAMARAASSQAFLDEQKQSTQPKRCLRCHAPQGGEGIACADCHGSGQHPDPKVKVPEVCARCHDAPGENTVRTFRLYQSQGNRKDCIACHTEGEKQFSHDFIGVSREGSLNGVAKIRLFLRREAAGLFAIIQIRHHAGHALPGGTTGRSVWLTMEGLNENGETVWFDQVRFGWEHHGRDDWKDRTLPPARATGLEFPVPDKFGARRLKANLIYRFRPGPLSLPDVRQVLLDSLEISLPES